MRAFIRDCGGEMMLRLLEQKKREDAEKLRAEQDVADGARGPRRSCRKATDAAIDKHKQALASPDSIDGASSEKQPVRADTAAMRHASGSWSWGRKLKAKRASTTAAKGPAATAERDAVVLQLEERLRGTDADRKADRKTIAQIESKREQMRRQLDELSEKATAEHEELLGKVTAEHEKLLMVRQERRKLRRSNQWFKPRAEKAASGWAKNEGQVTGLHQELAELKLQQKEMQTEIKELRAQLDAAGSAPSKMAQIPLLQRVSGGKEMKGGRKYPDWFYMTALTIVATGTSPTKIRTLLRIFQKTWLPFFSYTDFDPRRKVHGGRVLRRRGASFDPVHRVERPIRSLPGPHLQGLRPWDQERWCCDDAPVCPGVRTE